MMLILSEVRKPGVVELGVGVIVLESTMFCTFSTAFGMGVFGMLLALRLSMRHTVQATPRKITAYTSTVINVYISSQVDSSCCLYAVT